MERPRKVGLKHESGERGRQKVERSTKESEVSIQQRIQESPDQSLAEVDGKLCCVACRFFPANKASSIKAHVRLLHNNQPTAHAKKLEAWLLRSLDDKELKAFLLEYFESHPDEKAGSKNPDDLVYRYRIAESFVAHPPFAGIDHHNHLLQRAGHYVPASWNLSSNIPKIEAAENKLLDREMKGQYISIAFDGTSRVWVRPSIRPADGARKTLS
jgi:hypothetical protein